MLRVFGSATYAFGFGKQAADAFGGEVLCTFLLVTTIFAASDGELTRKHNHTGPLLPLVIGMAVLLGERERVGGGKGGREIYRQTASHAYRQAERQTYRQTERQTYRQTDRHRRTDRQTEEAMLAGRRRGGGREREGGGGTYRQTEEARERDRGRDKETGAREKERGRARESEREIENENGNETFLSQMACWQKHKQKIY